ncbi:hypothetical protein [Ursidibacter maritimus]|uniref:hypothetical protein n=1 Tax=Ursidibacter maritimus TaxID=1331689 RepID=UPI001C43CC7A|nr:hypothetical protein [Ursidibacter maritimus]MBV6540722.1 hypothetical protein [Ursidibacter maritimus]
MFNLNLFKRPIELSTLESWSKFCDDVGKVAFIAIPPMIYSNYALSIKVGNIIALLVITYGFLLAARKIRQFIDKEKTKWD